jgi:hypothetical protein
LIIPEENPFFVENYSEKQIIIYNSEIKIIENLLGII